MAQPIFSQPHVLLFPLPAQGDLSPMLKLAELLCITHDGFNVTFLNTTHNHQRMTRFTDIQTRFSRYPGFRFESISDGLPVDHPRAGGNWLGELLQGLKTNATPFLREMLPRSGRATRVTCLIVDSTLSFVFDLAKEVGVPVIEFKATGACYLWTYFCIPKLVENGEIPIKDEDMDKLVENVPGMTSFIRRRDLPDFFRTSAQYTPNFNFIIKALQTQEAHPIILNTFEDLEGPILSHLQAHYPRIYSIGPIQVHLKHRLGLEETTLSKSTSCSLWDEDQGCILWLDQKPNKSVIYVSFGSLTYLTRDQFMEFWAGLVQSKKYFLWVVRPNLITGDDQDRPTPDEILEGTKERGCMVGWAPQEEVLAHRAVGGFLTHSGWNSTLEGIIAGVPMLCWPYFYDQLVNSRYVSEVWKVGLDMKDTCDRNIIEKMINDLMDGRNDELETSTAKMSDLANKSICEGGSSYCNLNHLIEDIKAMSNNG